MPGQATRRRLVVGLAHRGSFRRNHRIRLPATRGAAAAGYKQLILATAARLSGHTLPRQCYAYCHKITLIPKVNAQLFQRFHCRDTWFSWSYSGFESATRVIELRCGVERLRFVRVRLMPLDVDVFRSVQVCLYRGRTSGRGLFRIALSDWRARYVSPGLLN